MSDLHMLVHVGDLLSLWPTSMRTAGTLIYDGTGLFGQ